MYWTEPLGFFEENIVALIIEDLFSLKNNLVYFSRIGIYRLICGLAQALLANVYLTPQGSPLKNEANYCTCCAEAKGVMHSGIFVWKPRFERYVRS